MSLILFGWVLGFVHFFYFSQNPAEAMVPEPEVLPTGRHTTGLGAPDAA
jgi:hypothetical protein